MYKFELTTTELQRMSDWADNLPLPLDTYAGASGGRFTFSFTPTSLGVVTVVTDQLTHETLDLTDYDSW